MPIDWKKWNPGLDNGHLTMAEVLATLPGNKQQEISYVVKLFENPMSPFAFRGAISLARHDMVHIVLGRGLLPQDEAFVIGFTMGTSKDISAIEAQLFQWITKYLYPAPYNFTDNHLVAFRLGLEAGKLSKAEEIYAFPFEKHKKKKLADIRSKIGLDVEELKVSYRREQAMLPETKESKRLII